MSEQIETKPYTDFLEREWLGAGGRDHESKAGRVAAFDAWSERRKREQGFFAGLQLIPKRVNDGSWNLASRHWPHLLCWQWILSWQFWRADERKALFRIWKLDDNHWGVKLLWVGQLVFQRQRSDRIAAFNERAPVIYSRRELSR